MAEVKAAPSVRKEAADRGIDLEALATKLGRSTIGREDLDGGSNGAASSTSAAATDQFRFWEVEHEAFGPVRREPTSRFDRIAARNLGAAQAVIPAVTHHDRADMSAVDALRARWKAEAAERGIKLTALAFHVKALARCLDAFPKFNASLTPDGETLVMKEYVHVGIAVDTEHGLMVPVIRDADKKGLWQIATDIADLAGRAQARKVGGDEMGGASMTISNLGGLGGMAFSPIVNPPEVAILGLTRTEMTQIWDGQDFVAKPMVPLDLSYDHRVINGADAARFLTHYARLIAEPRRLMI